MKLLNVGMVFFSVLWTFSSWGMDEPSGFFDSPGDSLSFSSISTGSSGLPFSSLSQERMQSYPGAPLSSLTKPSDDIIKHISDANVSYFSQNQDVMLRSLGYFLQHARNDNESKKNAINILKIVNSQSQCLSGCQSIIKQTIDTLEKNNQPVDSFYAPILSEYMTQKIPLQPIETQVSDEFSTIAQNIRHIELLIRLKQNESDISAIYRDMSTTIHSIVNSELDSKQQKKLLKDLLNSLQAIKPIATKDNTKIHTIGTPSKHMQQFAAWLRKEGEIKSAYRSLDKKQTESDNDKYQPGSDIATTSSHLPDMSLDIMRSSLDDLLNKTMILTDEDINAMEKVNTSSEIDTEEAIKNIEYKKFNDSCWKLIDDLQKLRQWRMPSGLKVLKVDLIDLLDGIVAFIHKYDLGMQKEKEYQSYRIWLLMLIKESIVANNSFSEEMINDWKIELGAIQNTTQKSITGTLMEESRLNVNEQIRVAKTVVTQKVAKVQQLSARSSAGKKTLSSGEKQQKEQLNKTIAEIEKGLKKNIFDTKVLSEYLTNLKKYKTLVVEEKEAKKIEKLIKITANKIKKLTIIAPRQKTWQEKFEQQIKKISTKDLENKTVEELGNTIKMLEERLPLELDYDVTQVLTDIKSSLYLLTVEVLDIYTQVYNEKSKLTGLDSVIAMDHFKNLSNKRNAIEYLAFNSTKDSREESNKNLWDIQESFARRLSSDVELLVQQAIGARGSFEGLPESVIEKMIFQYLSGYEPLEVFANKAIDQIREHYKKEKEKAEGSAKGLATAAQIRQRMELLEAERWLSPANQATLRQALVAKTAGFPVIPQKPVAKAATPTPLSLEVAAPVNPPQPSSVVVEEVTKDDSDKDVRDEKVVTLEELPVPPTTEESGQQLNRQPIVPRQSIVETYFVQPMINLWTGITNAISNFFSWYTAKDKG